MPPGAAPTRETVSITPVTSVDPAAVRVSGGRVVTLSPGQVVGGVDFAFRDVPPALTAPADQTARRGAEQAFSLGTFTDLGADSGPWSVSVNWGDGSQGGLA